MSDDLPVPSGGALPQEPQPYGSGGGYQNGRNGGWEPEPPLAEQGVDWRRYLAAVWRYKWLVLLVTALGTAGGVAAARFVKPEYEAQATIWIEASTPNAERQGPIRTGGLLKSSAWVDLLKSYVVLDDVVRDLHLYVRTGSREDAALLAGLELKERVIPGEYRLEVDVRGRSFELWGAGDRLLQRGALGDSVGPDVGFRWVPDAAALTPGRAVEFTLESPRDAAVLLGERLETRLDRNLTFLRLTLAGQDPERIAEILNAVGDRYLEVASDLKSAKLRELTRILDEQLQYAQQQLQESEAALESFRVQTITLPQEPSTPINPGLDITSGPAFSNFFALQIEREQLRRDRESIARVLAEARDSSLSVEGLEVIPAVREASDLVAALGELTTRRAELRAFRYRYSDEHDVVAGVLEEIETLEQASIPRLASRLMLELAEREGELENLISAASGELSEIPPRAIDEARLERRVRIAENLYTTLKARYEEARLAAASSIPDVRVLDAALPPRQPTNADEGLRLMLMALAASLGVALLGAVLLDRLDPRLAYLEQVSGELGLPVLGTLPHVKSESRWLGIQNTSEVVEAFRVIRLNLTHAYGSAGPVVVCITSPEPEDGKSFVTANLGLTFADMGRRTLVIDADIRRGCLHHLLGGSRKPGLIDYLAGQASSQEVVQATTHGPLYRIASGTRRHDGPELLQSAAMPALLAELRSKFDVILIDTPPLAAGVDALALGTLTGNMLIVLRTGATDRALTEAKLDMLDRLPIRVVGAILNDTPTRGIYRYHRYRYASGYEAYDEEPNPPAVQVQTTSVSGESWEDEPLEAAGSVEPLPEATEPIEPPPEAAEPVEPETVITPKPARPKASRPAKPEPGQTEPGTKKKSGAATPKKTAKPKAARPATPKPTPARPEVTRPGVVEPRPIELEEPGPQTEKPQAAAPEGSTASQQGPVTKAAVEARPAGGNGSPVGNVVMPRVVVPPKAEPAEVELFEVEWVDVDAAAGEDVDAGAGEWVVPAVEPASAAGGNGSEPPEANGSGGALSDLDLSLGDLNAPEDMNGRRPRPLKALHQDEAEDRVELYRKYQRLNHARFWR